MADRPYPDKSPFLPEGAGTALRKAIDRKEAMADKVDGLSINLDSGQFRHCRLIEGWEVRGGLQRDAGELWLTWLAVVPDDPQSSTRVTSRLLRLVPINTLLNQIRQRLIGSDEETRRAYLVYTGRRPAWPETVVREQRGRRRRTDDTQKQALLRRVAIAYLKEMTGEPGVYARLSKRLRRSNPDLTQEAIKALVRAARADGWLTGGRHGAAGAEAGPLLLQDERFTKGER